MKYLDADKMRGKVGKCELTLFDGPQPIVHWALQR